MNEIQQIESLFERFTGESASGVLELPSSGSNRRYFRVSGDTRTLVAVKGTCREENVAFWTIARHFREKGLQVPKVYAHSDDFMYYLQEDLGNDILYQRLAAGRDKGGYSQDEKDLLIRTVRIRMISCIISRRTSVTISFSTAFRKAVRKGSIQLRRRNF